MICIVDGKRENDPWAQPDPALAYALAQLDWFRRSRQLGKAFTLGAEVGVLMIGAATILAAAFQARPVVTAALASVSFLLTGMLKVSGVRDSWISFAQAWATVLTLVNVYRVGVPNSRDAAAQLALVAAVDEVVARTTGQWAIRKADTIAAGTSKLHAL